MSGLTLAYGHQPWTTAVHLQHALEQLGPVLAVGPGHGHHRTTATPGDTPLLWVESGIPWVTPPERLERSLSAAWLIDTHRGMRWRTQLAQAFDVVFVAQADAVEPLRRAGVPAHWLPLAAPDVLAGPGAALADRPYDVAFVGQAAPGSLRAQILTALSKVCAVAPTSSYVAPPEMMALYRQARVVVNLPWADDLNMRTFEATAARSLLVTGPATNLDVVLPDGSYALVAERSVEAWVRCVLTALADPAAQLRADTAYETIVARHTYGHRATAVLEALATTSRRTIAMETRVAGVAAAYARWGNPRACLSLPLGYRRMAPALATAAGWRTATLVASGRRSLSRIAADRRR